MKIIEKVWCTYDGFFCDELSISLLYEKKDCIVEYSNESDEKLTCKEVMDWVMNEYFNHNKFLEYCRNCKGRMPEDEKQLYQWDEDYRKCVDDERLYIFHLMGIEVTKVAKTFGVSRQTVYKHIKSFEENRLREFVK